MVLPRLSPPPAAQLVLHIPTGTRSRDPAPHHGPALIPLGPQVQTQQALSPAGMLTPTVCCGSGDGPRSCAVTCHQLCSPGSLRTSLCGGTEDWGWHLAPVVTCVGTTVGACATSAGALGTLRHPEPSSRAGAWSVPGLCWHCPLETDHHGTTMGQEPLPPLGVRPGPQWEKEPDYNVGWSLRCCERARNT